MLEVNFVCDVSVNDIVHCFVTCAIFCLSIYKSTRCRDVFYSWMARVGVSMCEHYRVSASGTCSSHWWRHGHVT